MVRPAGEVTVVAHAHFLLTNIFFLLLLSFPTKKPELEEEDTIFHHLGPSAADPVLRTLCATLTGGLPESQARGRRGATPQARCRLWPRAAGSVRRQQPCPSTTVQARSDPPSLPSPPKKKKKKKHRKKTEKKTEKNIQLSVFFFFFFFTRARVCPVQHKRCPARAVYYDCKGAW
jgi:hypothetical protein